MNKVIIFLLASCMSCSLSIAQNNQTNSVNQIVDPISFSLYTRDQAEEYLISNYPYMDIVDTLGVIYDYNFNDALTNFVVEHIHNFYDFIYEGVANQTITTDLQIRGVYNNFIDSTKSILSNTTFPKNPPTVPPVKQLNGPCVNMDFGDGTTNGWSLYDGNVDGSAPYSYVNNVSVGPTATHKIFSGGTDPVCGIPRVNPGSSFSCRLGDGTGTNYGAARMTQTFLVSSNNAIFSYSYAVVLNDPGHPASQQPYFTLRVYDELGNNVNCGSYSVYASASTLTDFQSTTYNYETVLYKDWTTVFSQLNGYMGQNITIEFTTGDCGQGGHFGYAYVDASCQPFDVTTSTGDTILCTGSTMTLYAPTGGVAYLWNTGETTETIDITTAGHYTVQVTPVQGSACDVNLAIDIAAIPTPVAAFNFSNPCIGDPVVFTDQSTITSPATIQNWKWDFGDGISTPESSGNITGVSQTTATYIAPNHTYSATGTYTVTETVFGVGSTCSNSITHQVTVNNKPTVNAGTDQSVCPSTQVTLSGSGATTYTWSPVVTNGSAFTPPAGTTTYTVTGTDGNNCTNTDQVNVTVYTSPTVNAGSDQTVCYGTNVTLVGSGATTYTWSPTVTNATAFTPAVGTITYTVTGTDGNNCTNTDQVNVTANPLPVIDAGADYSVCTSTPITLSGSGAGVGGVYTWDNGVTDGVAFTPTGTKTYTVVGTDANSCTGTDQITVTVLPNAPINAGLDQTICKGDNATITASGGVTYAWDNSLGAGASHTVSPVSTTTYTVVGTDAVGCVGTDQIVVTVNPLPTVGAGVDQTVCSGTSVTLSGSGATTYTWSPTVTNATAFTPAVGTITYTVTGTDGNSCTNTDQVNVTVNPLPVINAGADYSVCPNTPITLSGSGAGVGGVYTWDNSVTNGVAFTPTGTKTYTVVGTDANSCTGTDQITVTIFPNAPINAGLDQTICKGNDATITASGGVSYTWDNSLGAGASHTVSPISTTTYTVTGTDGNGCVGTDQVIVNVNTLPIVGAGVDQTICNGLSVTLSGSGAVTYTWNNGVTNGTAFTPPVGTTTYTVTGTDGNSCTNTDQVNVTVNPLPVINAGADYSVCPNTPITLSGSGAGVGGVYTWDNSVTNGVAFTPTGTKTYTVVGTDANSCTGTDQITVTIFPNAPINAGLDQTICKGNDATITASGGVSYTWDNSLGAGASHTVSPISTTTYTVIGTDGNGCVGTDQVIVNVNMLPIVGAGVDQTVCSGTSVTLSGSGAVTYTWNNGVTNGTAFTPPVGTITYTVTGTDGNNCTNTDQVNVTVNPLPVINAGVDYSVCPNTPITLSASGAGVGGVYTWDNSVTNGVAFTPTGTKTYTVVGTDANSCTGTDQITVTIFPNAPINAGLDQTICKGNDATITASGGVSYTWDNSLGAGASHTVSPISTTTYTVTGTDGNGCIGTDQVIVNVNMLPIVGAGVDQTVCSGTSVTLSGSGAVTYTWNNGVTNGTAFTPPVGTITYTVTGTDGNNCTNTDQVNVTVNPLPVINGGIDQTVCENTSITLTATGGTSYTWNPGASNGVAFIPTVGTTTYTVIGTDANGCKNTDPVNVTVNALPVVNAGPDQSVCNGTQTTLAGSGATTYTWNNSVTDGVPFTQVLGSTTYTVTGTDGNGCINTDQVVITVNPNPNPIINGADQYCAGFTAGLDAGAGYTTYSWSTGATTETINATTADNPITVTVTNSFGCSTLSPVFTVAENALITTNFSYQICQGDSKVIHGIAETTSGTYSQTYTSATGCDSTSNVTLTVNPLPNVNAGVDQAICIGASTSLTATGATTYVWDNGITQGTTFTPVVGTITYTVTGTDANGCINTDAVDVLVNPLPLVNAGTDQAICIGQATATLSGSNAQTYTWNNGVTDGVAFSPIATDTYTVTGTDVNGCINTDQVTVTVNSLPPVNAGLDQAVCDGFSVTLSGSGAGATGTYTWDNSITNGTSFIQPVGTTTYTVTGTDANGCTNTDAVDVLVNPLPTVVAGTDQAICDGFSATLSGSGAVSYTWDHGITNNIAFTPALGTITYTVTGTDANGCTNTDAVDVLVNPLPLVNAGTDQAICIGQATATLSGSNAQTYTWNNGVTNSVAFSPIVTDTYTVTGTDVNGCINTDQVTVTVNSLPPVNAGLDQAVCDGFSVTLSGSGAGATGTYTWDNSITNGTSFIQPVGTTTYTVTGTDANGCTNTDAVDVLVNPLPTVVAGTDQAICDGFSATLSGSGAVSYTWDHGITNNIAFTPALGTITYTVTGTDANGCINTDAVDVLVNPLPLVNAGTDQAICIGQATATLSGSNAQTYTWNNGVTNSVAFSPIVTDTYTVTGTDVNGCVNTDQVTVTVNSLPPVNAGLDQAVCDGFSVTLSGSGAGATGTYTWDNSITNGTSFIQPVGTTTYTVTGTDANGCTNTDAVDVLVNPLPTVVAGTDQAICDGFSATLSGAGAVSYTWDHGITNNIAFTPALGTITYTVTGTDANGCTNTDAVDVLVNPLPLVNAGTDQAICIGQATATLSGSNAQTYTWNNGVTNSVAFSPIVTDTYTVTGTDVNGCVNTDQVTVTVNSLPPVNAGLDQAVCDGFSVTLSGSGAGATGTYTWDNGVTNGVSFIQSVGTISYTVTGTDANGCTNTDMVQVLVNSLPVIVAGADQTVCNGTAVTLSGSGAGATGTYTWDNGVTNNVAFTQSVGTITYTVTGTDVNGCINTDNLDVTVNAIPVVNAGLDQAVCIGSQVTLTATGSTTYTWDNGITNGTAFTPAVGTITYTVTGTTLGCQSSDQVDVTVNPLPPVDAGVNFVSCEGQNVVLTGSGASSYTWDNGVSNGVDFVPAGTTTYHVIGTDANGCMNLDSVMITIIPTPVMDFTGNNLDGCSPLAASFTNNSTGNLVNCQWSFSNGQNLTGCGTVSETFINVGCYDVTLTVTTPEGCTNTLTKPSFACVEPNPVASFHTNPDKLSTIDWTAQMINTSSNSATYAWTFGDNSDSSTAFEPTHDFPHDDAGTYNVKLFVTSAYGCVDSTSRTVTVTNELIFYVPNTFTPDNNDYNETFKPVFATGYDPYDYTLYIFDRWGELLFESHNVDVGWDGTYGGKIVQDGTYIWKIIVKLQDSAKQEDHVGHINVLR